MPRVLIQFACTNDSCDGIIEEMLDYSDPNFIAERMSDGDSIEDHYVACPECGNEYVVETVSDFSGVTANVDGDDIKTVVQYEPDYDNYLSNYIPSNNTETDFINARDDLMELLKAQDSSADGILNRMIYSQMVAIMEAYLSDKILRLVTDHKVIRSNVIASADFMKNKNLPLADILQDPGKADKIFRLDLQKILYHDLEKVEKLYKTALKNDGFPTDTALRKSLEDAICIRHDCVHRNGRTMDGSQHLIDNAMISSLVNSINALVQHIEQKSTDAISKSMGSE